MVHMHAVVAAFRIYAQRGEVLLLKGKVGVCALNCHGNYIVDDMENHGKVMELSF